MRRARNYAVQLVTLLLALVWFGPVVWLAVGSLSTNAAIALNPLGAPGWHWDNYLRAWNDAHVGEFMTNSLLISLSSAVLIAAIATLAGYALARLRFRGKRVALAILLLGIGAPVFTYLIALSQLVINLNLLNTRTIVVLVNSTTFLPVPLLLLMAFFSGLPQEIADSARVDGAREWQVFVYVMLPLARPAIIVALTFGFIWAWNDLLLPAVFIQSQDKLTLPYGIANLHAIGDRFQQDYVTTFAASILSILPMLALYGYIQRRFISGLTSGAVKG